MRTIRYTAALATVVMSLMNLPFALDDGGAGLAMPVRILVSLLGLLGLGAAVALLAKASWGAAAVVAIGAVNLVGAVVSVAAGMEGGLIGLTVSLVMTGLAVAALVLQGRAAPRAA
ncbi:hypothetical protein ACFO1B_04425 [Dactylosporangium siamense]|uniref:Uncharacterized protein n=1 Tax=Dactylosporangium siamense TaxID=685454 RepID=A0A919U9Q2_9ACTN|nr:hypothetical protein [Dactylosporangium siamense]GIG42868.1 hypothetical protein Dsi01nite_009090 [Dactylosporangium siamense]